ncbi:MAG: plastocyanin/azurin family copper-binding protein [bacterium]
MRRHTALLALASIAALVTSCGGSTSTGTSNSIPTIPSTPATPVATTSVTLQNTAFSPANIQVAAGAVVTFTNNDAISHNVTFSSATVGSTGNYTSGSKTLTMPAAIGDYPFRCTLHAGMTGTVAVR